MKAMILACAVIAALGQRAPAGPEEFCFVSLQVRVTHDGGKPVEGSFVKAYSKDWPLVYPHEGFTQTDRDGMCRFRLPRGRWMVVAGGGAAYNSLNSGRGYFVVGDLVIEKDTALKLEPAPQCSFTLQFFDRSRKRSNVDTIYAAP